MVFTLFIIYGAHSSSSSLYTYRYSTSWAPMVGWEWR